MKTVIRDRHSDGRKQDHVKTTQIERTSTLSESFRLLQESFSSHNFHVHFDMKSKIYVDLDTSKERGFDVLVYHIDRNTGGDDFSKAHMKSILFLSKSLNGAESKLWPTELEVAGLIWMIQKMRNLIDSSRFPTIVYTDHSTTVAIVKNSAGWGSHRPAVAVNGQGGRSSPCRNHFWKSLIPIDNFCFGWREILAKRARDSVKGSQDRGNSRSELQTGLTVIFDWYNSLSSSYSQPSCDRSYAGRILRVLTIQKRLRLLRGRSSTERRAPASLRY